MPPTLVLLCDCALGVAVDVPVARSEAGIVTKTVVPCCTLVVTTDAAVDDGAPVVDEVADVAPDEEELESP
jgi:hypothetical protein